MIFSLFINLAFAEALHFDQNAVAKARATGTPLYKTSEARVIIAHHDTPGEVETHLNESDILLVEEGEAEIMVGGNAQGMKATVPGELRGIKLEGGKTYDLKKGEVLIIPKNEPHWFKKIIKPVDYVVIKQK